MKLFCKKNKIFKRWGLRPQTPVPPAAGGFAPKPPASGGWGLRPQTPIGRRPQTPKTAPRCEFLATRLHTATANNAKAVFAIHEGCSQPLSEVLLIHWATQVKMCLVTEPHNCCMVDMLLTFQTQRTETFNVSFAEFLSQNHFLWIHLKIIVKNSSQTSFVKLKSLGTCKCWTEWKLLDCSFYGCHIFWSSGGARYRPVGFVSMQIQYLWSW